MAVPIEIAAQSSMDLYYAQYKSPSDFYDLSDFVSHCGGIVGNLYMQGYTKEYGELKQERKDEVVSFDPGILNDQLLAVDRKDGELSCKLLHPVMSFPYDEQGIGLQDIQAIKPFNGVKFERTTSSAFWQLEYVPNCNIIYYYLQRDKVILVNKSNVNIQEIKIWYVPSIYDPAFLVPDGIFEFVVTTAAATIKEIVKGTIIKKDIDLNPNKIIQTELNSSALK
jgi:hypothetical protein